MRVLLIEDEVKLAETIRDGLSEHGVSTDVEHDGREALWRAREGSYDVIVLDIMLPGLNGYQVCRTLREDGIWTPILMLTAKDGEWDEAEALDTGADDFLSKPFSFVVLLARLRALARRPPKERPAVLQIGDLMFDVASASVCRGDTAIDLTRTEMQVLEALMRGGAHPVSKQQIYERVWGFDSDVDPKSVEVYIRYLRRKIDEPFDVATIKNQRGVGYRIVAEEE
ncbi:MAG: response regulator transcription factor [Acidimicrobiia bacterium]|nr:response regulator transcription factor [Acidimicrobiia bacterium]